MNHKKEVLPQSEKEWLKTGKFIISSTTILGNQIRYALTNSAETSLLVTMVGGIPRDPERRKKLPLINKLYGLMAVRLVDCNANSLLYNQPATGESSGNWDYETINTRSDTLANLIKYIGRSFGCKNHVIVGSSAGAYMAVKSLDVIKKSKNAVGKLILISPAAYPLEIEEVPYGNEFTKIICTPWDVARSPIFNRLEHFVKGGGSLLISFFESDDPPIPNYIQQYYCEFARKLIAQKYDVQLVTIPGVKHNFRRINSSDHNNIVDNASIRATADKFLDFMCN